MKLETKRRLSMLLLAVAVSRFSWKLLREFLRARQNADGSARILIVGAGEGGVYAVTDKVVEDCFSGYTIPPAILGGKLAIDLPSIAEKKAYIVLQLTQETWETELRIEMPHKHYVNMTPAVAECRSKMYAELHGGKV